MNGLVQKNHLDSAPGDNELEVSVIGPGYGESIVVHLGGGDWIVVDSCLSPDSHQPAPLDYLTALGLNPDESIRRLIVSHWHDDHIRGLSTIVGACPSVPIVVSTALTSQEFIKLAKLYSKQAIATSGTDEFSRTLRILETRREARARFFPLKFASADTKLLYSPLVLGDEVVEREIYSLSPSASATQQAMLGFTRAISEDLVPRRVASPRPNHTSIALWLRIGEDHLLLGSDLEETGDPTSGWSVIVSDSQVCNSQATFFKIPHHGSENGHSEDVWDKLLLPQPMAGITPYQLGDRALPTWPDARRIRTYTDNAYISARPKGREEIWHDGMVRKQIGEVTRSIRSLDCGWGHIRFRKTINDENDSWRVELFNDASLLDPVKYCW